MKQHVMLIVGAVALILGFSASPAMATTQDTVLPANGVTALSYSEGVWTIDLASADASEVKLITPSQEIACSEHEGQPKNGHALCDATSYSFKTDAKCVMVQVDWTDNKYNSSDPTKCRTEEEPPVVTEPPFEVKEVCATYTVDNFPENASDWPQTRVSTDCDYVPVVKCEEVIRIQFDKYWIRDAEDQAKYDALVKLNSSADDASLEPHDYYLKTITGEKCEPVVPEKPANIPWADSSANLPDCDKGFVTDTVREGYYDHTLINNVWVKNEQPTVTKDETKTRAVTAEECPVKETPKPTPTPSTPVVVDESDTSEPSANRSGDNGDLAVTGAENLPVILVVGSGALLMGILALIFGRRFARK